MKIDRLNRIIEGEGTIATSRPPNAEEMIDKINEIISYINTL